MLERSKQLGAAVTGDELVRLLETESRNGRMNARTASSCKSAVREVLRVQADEGWSEATVNPADVEGLLAVFCEAKDGDFTGGSISSYCSNFRRAVRLLDEVTAGIDAPTARSARMTYRFPLRSGVVATVDLPADLTVAEAERLASLIKALPMDES